MQESESDSVDSAGLDGLEMRGMISGGGFWGFLGGLEEKDLEKRGKSSSTRVSGSSMGEF